MDAHPSARERATDYKSSVYIEKGKNGEQSKRCCKLTLKLDVFVWLGLRDATRLGSARCMNKCRLSGIRTSPLQWLENSAVRSIQSGSIWSKPVETLPGRLSTFVIRGHATQTQRSLFVPVSFPVLFCGHCVLDSYYIRVHLRHNRMFSRHIITAAGCSFGWRKRGAAVSILDAAGVP